MFEEQKDRLTGSLASKIETERTRVGYIKLCLIGLTGTIFCWLAALFIPENVADGIALVLGASDTAKKYLLVIPLGFAFIAAFALCRMRRDKSAVARIDDSDFFSVYRDHQKSERLRNAILISGAVSGATVIALVFATIWFRGML